MDVNEKAELERLRAFAVTVSTAICGEAGHPWIPGAAIGPVMVALEGLETCDHELDLPWRDEDMALRDPALAGITTCQRQRGHGTIHSARTEAETAEIMASLDAASALRRLHARARETPTR